MRERDRDRAQSQPSLLGSVDPPRARRERCRRMVCSPCCLDLRGCPTRVFVCGRVCVCENGWSAVRDRWEFGSLGVGSGLLNFAFTEESRLLSPPCVLASAVYADAVQSRAANQFGLQQRSPLGCAGAARRRWSTARRKQLKGEGFFGLSWSPRCGPGCGRHPLTWYHLYLKQMCEPRSLAQFI